MAGYCSREVTWPGTEQNESNERGDVAARDSKRQVADDGHVLCTANSLREKVRSEANTSPARIFWGKGRRTCGFGLRLAGAQLKVEISHGDSRQK